VRGYVLDASALMTLFDDRSGADKVEELLVQAAESKHPLLTVSYTHLTLPTICSV